MTTSGTYFAYKVTNNANGKFYIGITSRCINLRWKEHVRHAKKQVNSGHFYKAIRKHGPESFTVNVISQYDSPDKMKKAEINLIAELSPEYNSTLGGDGTWGHKVSKEIREKMKLLHLGNKYNLGRKWPDKERLAMSAKKKGCKPPPITEKMKITRVENCRKASSNRRKKVICVNDNKIFNSVTEAAKEYNIDKTTVSSICLQKRNQAYGLKFKFLEVA